ncbi:MAG: ASCH domain-containing protein [Bacilli bacterium]|nr:ASCH domain-containing protein [Bacilli bacterium]
MKHEMRLHNEPFELIKNGTKTIELRLNDEKRQLINIGDVIEFENRTTLEKISVKVINLHKYNSFEDLYKHFDKISMGYSEDEEANPKDIEKYYSKEEQNKYDVVGIEMKLIEK